MVTDDKLTAYVLNELPPDERAAVEAHLAANPEAERIVAAHRALAADLTAALAAEPHPLPLAEPKVAAVTGGHGTWKWVAALAACALVSFSAGVYSTANNNPQNAGVASQSAPAPVLMNNATKFAKQTGSNDVQTAVYADGIRAMNESTAAHAAAEKNFKDKTAAIPSAVMQFDKPQAGYENKVKDFVGTQSPSSPPAPAASLNPFMPVDALTAPMDGRTATRKPSEARGKGEPKVTGGSPFGGFYGGAPDAGRGYDRFPALVENDFVKVEGQNALSTFGVDVDTASYTIVRKFLGANMMPPPGAVRLEEMVNYFPYRDAPPTGPDPFGVTVELAECPWQPKNRLARIGLKAKPIDYANRPASNLVFLVDVSGSMDAPNRLPLVKQSLKMLVDQLGENDRVAMVTYASGTGVALESTSAMRKDVILAALDRLVAGGSTNGSGGIQLAYETAVANFIQGGTNRVILCTDGDWNVGTTSTDELIKLIEEKKKSNVFLSVLGFGMGNLRDEMMVNLAGKGNGNYAYIESLREAKKALVDQLGGTLVTVAKDVKIQIEFNPAKVGSYRLLGYEKRKLANEDFHNDAKDAGEMGAGHVVTALYELTPPGTTPAGGVDALRFQQNAVKPAGDDKLAFIVKLRHKLPESDKSTLREIAVPDSVKPYGEAHEDFRFAAAVASLSMLLRDSPHKGNATYAAVAELAGAAKTWDPGAYRAEFLTLVQKAKATSGKP